MKSALVIDFRACAFDFDRLQGTRLCRADVRIELRVLLLFEKCCLNDE